MARLGRGQVFQWRQRPVLIAPAAQLSGAVVSTSVVTGSLNANSQLTGSIASTSVVTGSLTATPKLSGAVISTSVVTGSLAATTQLSGAVISTSVVAGSLAAASQLTGSIASVSSVLGSLTAPALLSGGIASISTVVGTISSPTFLSGSIANTSLAAGTLTIDSAVFASAGLSFSSVTEIARYTPMLYPSNSYYTQQVYQTLPESLQEQDATSGYKLWYFIQSMVNGLDNLSVLFFDSIGAGTAIFPVNPGITAYTPGMLKNNITFNATTMTIFNTDSTWSQIDTSNPFPIEIEGERMLVPAGNYNWEATEVTFTNVQRGWDNTVQVEHLASSGANGEFDIQHYFNAPGWSQILDINRCPAYALPWLGQFVGVDLTKTPNLTYEQSVQKILSRPGFSRGTVPALQNSLAAYINNSLASSASPINPSQIICLENTAPIGNGGMTTLFAAISGTGATTLQLIGVGQSWLNAAANSPLMIQIGTEDILIPQGVYSFVNGPVSIAIPLGNRGKNSTTAATHVAGSAVTILPSPSMYQYNQYGITLLVPAGYFNLYSYDSLLVAAGGAGTTYTTLDSFIAGLGPTNEYANLNSSAVPSSNNSFASYVYSQRPAGVEVFVGCY